MISQCFPYHPHQFLYFHIPQIVTWLSKSTIICAPVHWSPFVIHSHFKGSHFLLQSHARRWMTASGAGWSYKINEYILLQLRIMIYERNNNTNSNYYFNSIQHGKFIFSSGSFTRHIYMYTHIVCYNLICFHHA